MNTGEWLAIGLSAFFLLWFVGGAAVNRQRGHRLGERLTAGLSQLGKVETVRREKLMQSSAHLRVTGLTPPFTRLEAIYSLEPRENFPLWLYGRINRRRDAFFLRADLTPAPPLNVEAGRKDDSAYARHLASQLKKACEIEDLPGRVQLAWSGKKDDQFLKQVSAFVQKYAASVVRLSLQRSAPHLTLKVELAPLESYDPGDLMRDLRAALTG